jgi:scyllo-inositol 2-dehydrogenase (NADP+)
MTAEHHRNGSGPATSDMPTPRRRHDAGKLRTALIGFGISGRVFHAPLIQADPAYSLDIIVTSRPERAADACATYPHAKVLANADEMFAGIDGGEHELDLIVIGTPPGNHKELALAAIDHGLNVVVDKPFVPSSRAGDELIAAANKAQVSLTVFQNRRWDGDFLTVKRLINDERLGEIRTFESRFEWWMPEGFGNWRDAAHIDEGGGILHDLGAHLIDQAIQLFGPAKEVHGETDRYNSHDQSDADHAAFISIMHQSGVRSRLWMNGHAAQPGPRFHILGSKGAYLKWGLDGQEAQLASGVLPGDAGYGVEPVETWGSIGITGSRSPEPTDRGNYPAFYQQLAQSLQGRAQLPVDPNDAVEVLRIIETARPR